jgi:hypothetical protein
MPRVLRQPMQQFVIGLSWSNEVTEEPQDSIRSPSPPVTVHLAPNSPMPHLPGPRA